MEDMTEGRFSLEVDNLDAEGDSLLVDIIDSRGCSLVVDVLVLRGGSLVAKTVDAGTCSRYASYVVRNIFSSRTTEPIFIKIGL